MSTAADHIARRPLAAGARHAFGIPGGEGTPIDTVERAPQM